MMAACKLPQVYKNKQNISVLPELAFRMYPT